MVITESLAKGLTKRFFAEMSEEIDRRILSTFSDIDKMKPSLNGWQKFVLKTREKLDRCALVTYEGGGKRKPYFGFCGLTMDKTRGYNSWQEKCLSATTMIMTYDTRFCDSWESKFNVGEHAISRVYQRGKIKMDNMGQIDIYSIVPEFQLLPIWTMYWLTLILELNQNEMLGEIYPVLPANSGLFMAEFKDNSSSLEIRTFVDDSHLDQKQLQVKNLMINASEGLQHSPLALYPGIEVFDLDDAQLERKVMSYRIAGDSELIADVVFHRIKNKDMQLDLKKRLKTWIENNSLLITKEISDMYKGINIREINNQIRHAQTRSRSS